MTYLAHLGASISIFLTALFTTVFGIHAAMPLPVQNEPTAASTTSPTSSPLISGWTWLSSTQLPTTRSTAGGVASFWNDNGVIADTLTPLQPQADFGTFEAFCGVSRIYVSCSFAKDKNYVYVANGLNVLAGADPTTIAPVFYPAHTTEDIIYLKDASHVWRYETQGIAALVPGADPATFTILGYSDFGFIAKDKNHVYIDTILLPDANSETAVLVSIPWGNGTQSPYLKDAGHVWWLLGQNPMLMPTVDPATFTFVGLFGDEEINTYISKDKNYVYADDAIVPEIDAGSFVMLPQPFDFGSNYEKDRNHVYSSLKIIPGADPATFVVVESPDQTSDARDKNHTYLYGQIIQ